MLTKAILTGGVLALLSGSIVYFGTEGADALETDDRMDVRVEETELAGAAVAESDIIRTVEAQGEDHPVGKTEGKKPRVKKPRADSVESEDAETDSGSLNADVAAVSADPVDPQSQPEETKPKTRWLDQYLKSSKPRKDAAPEVIDAEETMTVTETTEIETPESEFGEILQPVEQKAVRRKKIVVEMDDDGTTSWTTDDGDIDLERIEDLMRDSKDANTDIRIVRLDGRTKKSADKPKRTVDYARVLEEARKLQVIDMRNIALFEIIDYAIDKRDFGQAADILQELSDPELRDTARAKIGVGLAKTGDSDAAFAVLDEMEIAELTASMRLEIITALMATKAERSAPGLRR